jgi:hypothetical protein
MESELTYEGESLEGKLQEALDKALGQLDKDLDKIRAVTPPKASWKIVEITGERGGLGRVVVRMRIKALVPLKVSK